MTDETADAKVPTEMEHAMATARLFRDVYNEIAKGGVLGQVDAALAVEAAKLATQNTMRHYHYVLEAAGKSTSGPVKASEKQVNYINSLIASKRLFISEEDYGALKSGTLSIDRASAILDGFKQNKEQSKPQAQTTV